MLPIVWVCLRSDFCDGLRNTHLFAIDVWFKVSKVDDLVPIESANTCMQLMQLPISHS